MLTLEEQRRRIENVKYANENVKACTRRERIENYLPGQVTYHLGDYPAKFSCRPTEYDYNLIKKFAESGVELIQTHMDASDYLRLYGTHKFDVVDPEGMKEFIKTCHDFGIKVINYISSGFLMSVILILFPNLTESVRISTVTTTGFVFAVLNRPSGLNI